MILEATHSAIFSPVSADGAMPCGLPDGQMTDLFGLALAPANPSALRAPSVAAQMSATYGLRSSTSSASAALAASLASRLPELLDSRGSIMFALTWKAQVTPQRRLICALRAQAHRTSDKGYIGWPTPTTSNAHSYPTDRAKDKNRDLPTAALTTNLWLLLGLFDFVVIHIHGSVFVGMLFAPLKDCCPTL